jgi:hypothetical protein
MLDVIGSTSSTTSTSNIYRCIYPLNLLGVQKLSIKSEKLAVQTASSVDYSFSNTLVAIPVDVSPFSMISYTSQSDANNWTEIYYRGTDNLTFRQYVSSAIVFEVVTNALLRDVSAWYHLVIVLDTTQATASNRLKLYINGVDQSLTFNSGTYPTQNSDLFVNAANAHYIGQRSSAVYPNHYMTEVNFIDGQALTPTSFGYVNPTTGIWSPAKFVGGYGTNGFYLNFSDNSNTTAATLGADYSGNGNNWTPNNFSVTAGAGNDSLVDSPTSYGVDTGVGGEVRGNYATLNPLDKGALDLTDGNLTFQRTSSLTNWEQSRSTIQLPSSGKWYWECKYNSGSNDGIFNGVTIASADLTTDFAGGTYAGYYGYTSLNGSVVNNNSSSVLGSSLSVGDTVMIAVDVTNTNLWIGVNGTWLGSGNPATNTNASIGSIPAGVFPTCGSRSTGNGSVNFGQRAFTYTAPSGFKALNTQNLPTPTIGATSATLATQFFAPVIYTGNGTTNNITVGFQPDFLWFKTRSNALSHALYNSISGVTKFLTSNTTAAEATSTANTDLISINPTGFTVGPQDHQRTNESGYTYVAWNWRAGGTAVSNTSGSITSTVSANTTAGFSVVTFTKTATTSQTIGHGLGVAPSMIIVKERQNAGYNGWAVFHTSTGIGNYLELNTTVASQASSTIWNNTLPTSTVFSMGTAWTSTVNMIAYCFAPIAGYSAFGSYTGNGSADGPFTYTGFRPAFVMIKVASGNVGDWCMYDTSRNTSNVVNIQLFADTSQSESGIGSANFLDILSNGFKNRNTAIDKNASGGTYIYMAFASNPFKYSLAR